MWRITAVAGLVAVMAIAVLPTQTTPVHACSPGPDFDPIAESAIVVGGRLVSWEIASGEAREDLSIGSFPDIRVHMTVDQVFKGPSDLGQLSFIDGNSLVISVGPDGEDVCAGSGGGCGAFNADPTGAYTLMGLSRGADGEYSSSLPNTFFLGDAPSGEAYESALVRMASFPAAASLPALGSGPAPSTTNPLVAAVAALGAALLAASFAIRFGTRRSS